MNIVLLQESLEGSGSFWMIKTVKKISLVLIHCMSPRKNIEMFCNKNKNKTNNINTQFSN